VCKNSILGELTPKQAGELRQVLAVLKAGAGVLLTKP
jgi:hypothetical protein